MKFYIFVLIISLLFITSCGPQLIVSESFEELQLAADNDPNNSVHYYNLGLKYYSEKEYKKSIEFFNKAIQRSPHFADAYYGIYCAELLNDTELRKESLKELPDDKYLNKMDSLSTYFQNALMFDPLFKWNLGALLLPQKQSAMDYYSQYFLDFYYKLLYDGISDFFLGKYKNASKELSFSLSVIPKFHQARYFRGLAKCQLNDFKGAIEDFDSLIIVKNELNKEKILPVYQETSELNYFIGYLYLQMGEFNNAKFHFEKALEEDMSLYMAHFQLSNVYQKQNNFKEAFKEINSAILLQPEDPILYFNKGVFLSSLGQKDLAIEAYLESINLSDYSYKAAFNLGALYEEMGNKKEAAKFYDKFIKFATLEEHTLVESTKNKINGW